MMMKMKVLLSMIKISTVLIVIEGNNAKTKEINMSLHCDSHTRKKKNNKKKIIQNNNNNKNKTKNNN